jgi:hypothetical protein
LPVNAGEIEIELGGGRYVLRSSLGAHKAVNMAFGGFVAALRELQNFNSDAYVAVVAAGLGKKSNSFLEPEAEKKITIEEAVYEAGLEYLNKPLSKFVGLLLNGGREPKDETSEGKKPGEE